MTCSRKTQSLSRNGQQRDEIVNKMTKVGVRILSVYVALALAGCAPKGEELYARAAASLEKGDTQSAIIDLKNLVQSEPQNGKARALLGEALILSGDLALGEIEMKKAVDLGVPAAEMLVANCRILLSRGRFAEVLDQCKPDAVAAGDQQAMQITQGNALLGLGRGEEAKAAFVASMTSQPPKLESYLGLAAATSIVDGAPAGITALQGAPSELQARPTYWLALGAMNLGTGDFAAAEAAYQKGVEIAEKDKGKDKQEILMALGGLAEAQMKSGNVAAADATSARLMEVAPKNPLAKQLRAQVAAAGGKLDEARGLLEGIVSKQPDNVSARLLLGYVNLQQGNLDQAEMHVQTVVAQNPANPAAQKLLAEVRAKQSSPGETMASVRNALEQTSNDPTMLAVAGRMSLASGDRQQALAYLAEASKPGTEMTPAAQMEVANGYMLAGELDKALEILKAVPDSSAVSYQRDSMLLLSLLRKGDEAELLSQSKAILAKSGTDPVVRNLVGSVYAAANKMDMAREQFDEALRLAPGDKQALINRAKVELAQGNPAAAEPFLKKVLEKEPKDLMATMAMAAVAGARKDNKAVETYLVKAKDDHKASPEAQSALAQFYITNKEPAKAKAVMDAAVAANPANARMANTRGVVMIGTNDMAAAIASFDKAVQLEPSTIEFTMNLARAKAISGDTKGALVALDDLLKQQPKSVPALSLAAATSLRSGELERATGYIERIRQVAPDSQVSNQFEGDLAMAQKRFRDAAAAYAKADPKNENRNIALARYAAAQGAGESQPEKTLEEWLTRHPDDADMIGIMAESKRSAGDVDGAALMYEQALAKAPGSAVLHNNLAMVYLEKGDSRALSEAEKAHKLLPQVPAIMDTYGWALFKAGQTEKAVEVLRSAAKGLPDNAEVQFHLASALAASGKKSEALALAKKAVGGSLPPALRAEATKLLAELQ
jgi:cellulose synthase operon protein C